MSTAAFPTAAGRPRPGTLVAAVAITVAMAVLSLATLPMIPDDAPGAVVVISAVAAAITSVGAWGLWSLKRWGAITVFVFTALNGLAAMPGPFAAPDTATKVLAAVGVVTSAAVCVLILMPATRAAIRRR
ncbi:hypothetical protein AYO38_10440 [bacterium SCGC AG-212-C10]|nr:hypothetical protein AYO38_10440 [bacterium SCGC AG-212-C10]